MIDFPLDRYFVSNGVPVHKERRIFFWPHQPFPVSGWVA